jgi:hypothetical protein
MFVEHSSPRCSGARRGVDARVRHHASDDELRRLRTTQVFERGSSSKQFHGAAGEVVVLSVDQKKRTVHTNPALGD